MTPAPALHPKPVIKDEYEETIKEFPAKITFLFKMSFVGVARAFFMVAKVSSRAPFAAFALLLCCSPPVE